MLIHLKAVGLPSHDGLHHWALAVVKRQWTLFQGEQIHSRVGNHRPLFIHQIGDHLLLEGVVSHPLYEPVQLHPPYQNAYSLSGIQLDGYTDRGAYEPYLRIEDRRGEIGFTLLKRNGEVGLVSVALGSVGGELILTYTARNEPPLGVHHVKGGKEQRYLFMLD